MGTHPIFESDFDCLTEGSVASSDRTRRLRTTSATMRRGSMVQDHILPIMKSNRRRTVYTKGKPLWFTAEGENAENCYVIGIAGGSASGKTSVAKKIIEGLDIPYVVLLQMDSFFKGVDSEEDKLRAKTGDYNFDCPAALDWDLMVKVLTKLKAGKAAKVPFYSFVEHRRIPSKSEDVYGASVLIFDGIMALYEPRLLDLMDMKVFVDTDADIRLARRIMRDISERGRQLPDILNQYNKHVKPGYNQYIGPTICNADVVIPRGRENHIAIKLIIQHIKKQLELRHIKTDPKAIPQHVPANLHELPRSNQIIGILTIIRNNETTRDDFIFYSERLMRRTFEYALSFLPHRDVTVSMPSGEEYIGKKFAGQGLCGVSIVRAGETMEQALMKVTKDIRLGKILIQTNEDGEPLLHYHRLPVNKDKDFVVLMDPIIGTGGASMMAIRVLLDHDVAEENIILVCLLMAKCGAQAISYAFPRVKIITSAVDEDYNYETRQIIPGLGNFGNRYFGTC